MQIAKVELPGGEQRVAVLHNSEVRVIVWSDRCRSLSDILHAADPVAVVNSQTSIPVPATTSVKLLAPVDHQEIWAAGVTYKRSQVARMEESETGASHYDRVYTAPRPELFFKSMPRRVSGPGGPVRI